MWFIPKIIAFKVLFCEWQQNAFEAARSEPKALYFTAVLFYYTTFNLPDRRAPPFKVYQRLRPMSGLKYALIHFANPSLNYKVPENCESALNVMKNSLRTLLVLATTIR